MRFLSFITLFYCLALAGQVSAQVAEEDLFRVDTAVLEHGQLTLAAEAGKEAYEAYSALLAAKKVEESAQSVYDDALEAAVEKSATSTENQDESLEMLAANLVNRELIKAKASVRAARATFEAKQRDYIAAIGTGGIELLAPAKQKEIENLAQNFKDLFAQVEAMDKKVTKIEAEVAELRARDGRTTTWCIKNVNTKLCRERTEQQEQ